MRIQKYLRPHVAYTNRIFKNEIIHILIHFIETRQLGMEQESAKYGNATKKGRTLNYL